MCPTVFAPAPAGAPAAEPAADGDDVARHSPVVYVVPVPITVPTAPPQPALTRQEEDDASRQLCKQVRRPTPLPALAYPPRRTRASARAVERAAIGRAVPSPRVVVPHRCQRACRDVVT